MGSGFGVHEGLSSGVVRLTQPGKQIGGTSSGAEASRRAALGLQVHDRMAGKLLPFAGVGKETMNVVPARSGQSILDAPDFLKHQVAAALNRWFVNGFHRIILREVLPAGRSPEGCGLAFPQPTQPTDDPCIGNVPAIPRQQNVQLVNGGESDVGGGKNRTGSGFGVWGDRESGNGVSNGLSGDINHHLA